MEQYTFRIQTKVFPKKHSDGKMYITFKAVSPIDREDGTRKESVKVSRNCFCEGQVWTLFKSRKKMDELCQKSVPEFMSEEQYYLGIGREVLVKGITDEQKFGKKGMLVTYAEVITNVKREQEPFFSATNGFIDESIEKEF